MSDEKMWFEGQFISFDQAHCLLIQSFRWAIAKRAQALELIDEEQFKAIAFGAKWARPAKHRIVFETADKIAGTIEDEDERAKWIEDVTTKSVRPRRKKKPAEQPKAEETTLVALPSDLEGKLDLLLKMVGDLKSGQGDLRRRLSELQEGFDEAFPVEEEDDSGETELEAPEAEELKSA